MAFLSRSTQMQAAIGAYEHIRTGDARAVRERAGWSLDDLAAHLGVAADDVARWESGERLPIGRRAEAYGAALEHLAAPQDQRRVA